MLGHHSEPQYAYQQPGKLPEAIIHLLALPSSLQKPKSDRTVPKLWSIYFVEKNICIDIHTNEAKKEKQRKANCTKQMKAMTQNRGEKKAEPHLKF